jgi:hypothetical protein
MKREELRYEIEVRGGPNGNRHVLNDTDDTTAIRAIAVIERGFEAPNPFGAYVGLGNLVGLYRTVVDAIEGVVDYCAIVQGIDLVDANTESEPS